jgi:uncharacterized protein YjiS (DUF1127 family)
MLIMTLATKSFASISTSATRAAAQLFAAVRSIPRALVNRREVLRLTELDERGLKDIGLLRGDVEGALASSWLGDPSAVLAARAGSAAEVASVRRAEAELKSDVPAQAAPAPRTARVPDIDPRVACCA